MIRSDTNSTSFAISITLLGYLCFIIQDSSIKWLSTDVVVLQILFVRGLFALGFLVVGAGISGNTLTLKCDRPWLMLLRTLTNVVSWGFFFYGLKYLPLATATALFFSFPIYLTALSIPLLGEKSGIRRWSAMLVGFIGVVLMTKPGAEFQWSALLMICAALGWASVAIMTRKLSDHSNASSMLFHTLIGFAITLAIPQFWVWQSLSIEQFSMIAIAAFFGVIAQLCLVKAYSIERPSVIAPFEYSGLVWAAVFGFLIWNDVPDWVVLLGAALIVGSNIYITRREALLSNPNIS